MRFLLPRTEWSKYFCGYEQNLIIFLRCHAIYYFMLSTTLSSWIYIETNRLYNLNRYFTPIRFDIWTIFERPFVKRFALCYWTVVLSVCPVCNVGVLWPNGWMDHNATWYRGRPRPRPHYVRWGPSSPMERGSAPPTFRPTSIVAKRSPISATAGLV